MLLSVRLVSDPKEWGRFSDWGTTIIEGIDQGLQLFKSFDFVNASGNLMIVFTDGRDSELNRQNRPLDQLVAEARRYRIPVYMIRTAYRMPFGRVQQDKIWQPVIERTGGRFYAAPDEESIFKALAEIDRLSPGKIEVRQYSVQRPRYAGFALGSGADPEQVETMRTNITKSLALYTPGEDEAMLRSAGFREVQLFYAAFTWRGWVAYA